MILFGKIGRNRNYGLSVLTLILTVGCASLDSDKKHEALKHWNYNVNIDSIHPNVSVLNSSNSEVTFKLKLNDLFPMAVSDMISEIRVISSSNGDSDAMNAWRFVCDNTFHLDSFTRAPWMHEPYIQVNSLAGGLCDDRASALAELWAALGYKSRLIQLNGHAVPEVMMNGKWELYDPDLEVYYTKDDSVVSVHILEQSGGNGIQANGAHLISSKYWNLSSSASGQVMKKYSSANDNHDSSNQDLKHEESGDLSFTLPSGSEMIIVQGNGANPTTIVVRLNANAQGKLHLPLVPYAMMGEGKISIGSQSFTSKANSIAPIKPGPPPQVIHIDHINGGLNIYYHVNPIICKLFKTNTLSISEATGTLLVRASTSIPVVVDEQRADAIRFDSVQHVHQHFLERMGVENMIDSKTELSTVYHQFLDSDVSLSAQAKKEKLAQFDTSLQLLLDTLGVSETEMLQLLGQNYPRGLYWILLTMRYDTYPYLHKLYHPEANRHYRISP